MGKKRKHSDDSSDERILRKLRKLEKKLRQRSSETRSESKKDDQAHHALDGVAQAVTSNVLVTETEPVVLDLHTTQNKDVLPSQDSEKDDLLIGEVTHLDDDILNLLGDAPTEECPVGPDVHIDIATRLQDILENGMKKEAKDKITEEYPIPGNCQLFKAPILNPEVKAAISDLLHEKASSLAARQTQIGIALSALTKAMNILVTDRSEPNQALVKHVSNACRLLCDSHYIDTRMRRNFLISTINNKLKDTLKESKRDKNLFGEDLPEKIKATKAITKSSQDLKCSKPKPVLTRNATPVNPSTSNLNWKHPQTTIQTRKPAPVTQSSAGPSTSFHHRNETTRRQPATRARGYAHFKKRP